MSKSNTRTSKKNKGWKSEYSGSAIFVCTKCGDKATLSNSLVAIKKAKGRGVVCFKCKSPMTKLPA